MDLDTPNKKEFVIQILEYLVRDLPPIFRLEPGPETRELYERAIENAQTDTLYGHAGHPLICRAWSVLLNFGIAEGLGDDGLTWKGTEYPPVLKIRIALEEVRSHVQNNIHTIPGRQTFEDCLAGLITVADWMAWFPTTRTEFPAERLSHYDALIPHLERIEFLYRNFLNGELIWTDAAAPTMRLAGVWNEHDVAIVDLHQAFTFQMWHEMPKPLRQQAYRVSSKAELRQILHDHWRDGWHVKKLTDKEPDFGEIYILNIVWPSLMRARAKTSEQGDKNLKRFLLAVLVFALIFARALFTSGPISSPGSATLKPATSIDHAAFGLPYQSALPASGPTQTRDRACDANSTSQPPVQGSGLLAPIPIPCFPP